MIINAVNLSILTGTTKANISKLTRNGKLIRNENKKYDTDNLTNSEYIISHGITKSELEKFVLALAEKKPIDIKRIKPSQVKKAKKEVNVKKTLPKSENKKDEKNDEFIDFDNNKIEHSLRSGLQLAVKNNQKRGKMIELLGCNIDEFKIHLRIQDGYDGDKYHMDHIIPVALYDLTDIEEQKKCFNYKNIRLISKDSNLGKGKFLDYRLIKELDIEYLLPKSKEEKPQDFNEDDFEDITGLPSRMMNMTMKQLVMKYGGSMQLKTWADILNKIMMASERDQKIQIRKLELIEKDFVISRIFSYLETMHNQIFNIPLSLTDHVIALAISKKDKARQEIIEMLKKELEKLLKDCKKRISNEIDNLKSKYEFRDEDV